MTSLGLRKWRAIDEWVSLTGELSCPVRAARACHTRIIWRELHGRESTCNAMQSYRHPVIGANIAAENCVCVMAIKKAWFGIKGTYFMTQSLLMLKGKHQNIAFNGVVKIMSPCKILPNILLSHFVWALRGTVMISFIVTTQTFMNSRTQLRYCLLK